MTESSVDWFGVREKYYSLVEKVRLISQTSPNKHGNINVSITFPSVYLELGRFDPFQHSSNLTGQITQKKPKAKFVWLKPFAHTSNFNRINHTNNQIKKFEWNIPLFHTDYPNTHHPPSRKWTLHSKWTKK